MVYVILALAALFLFVLGIFLLGGVSAKATGALSLIIGATTSIFTVILVTTDALGGFGPTTSYAVGVGGFQFFMLYWLIGIEVFAETDFKATGWYSLLAGLFAFLLGLGWFNILGTALPLVPQFGVWFIIWAIAFWLVFLVFAMGYTALTKLLAWWLIIPTVLFTLVYPIIAYTNFGKIGF